jgi:hypothetical protein
MAVMGLITEIKFTQTSLSNIDSDLCANNHNPSALLRAISDNKRSRRNARADRAEARSV